MALRLLSKTHKALPGSLVPATLPPLSPSQALAGLSCSQLFPLLQVFAQMVPSLPHPLSLCLFLILDHHGTGWILTPKTDPLLDEDG